MALVLLVLGRAVPIDSGPIAVLLILSPHLALASAWAIPVALLARSKALGGVLVGIAAVFVLRFGAEWWSSAPAVADGSARLDVATWNVESGVLAGPAAIRTLNDHPVDLVVIEELTPTIAQAIEGDERLRARYPHRALFPEGGVGGIGLLSAFPIENPTYQQAPVRLEARVALDDGPVVVLGAHPFPAAIDRSLGIPLGFDPGERNAELALLRSRVAELDAGGERVLLVGDFNTAPTEPAFDLLVRGLKDAHAEVGVGPGWTWRPARFAFLGIGLLRIDLVLSTSQLIPVSTGTDCPPTGDHCLVWAELTLAP